MKCEILTFQFAHNYGAALQCYALKKYLESKNISAAVSDFVPDSVKNTYALWPRLYTKNPVVYFKEILRSFRRMKQYKIFNSFISQELISEQHDEPIDYLVIGSDQVWNEEITGKISKYYGSDYYDVKKISYAGSFGTSKLTDFQKKNIEQYFPTFENISLRELCNVQEVKDISKANVDCVLDPVFLLERKKWSEFGVNPGLNKNEKYILYYSLRQDNYLVNEVIRLSKKYNCKVYAIHPTCIKMNKEFVQLNDIGPKEFVYLIENAYLIGTNSFHAVSFASIFGKKVVNKLYMSF